MLHAQFELSSCCNLACVECPHRFMQRKQSYMQEDVFNKLLSYISILGPDTVILHKDGEPLLHPNFKDYFSRIAERTNAKIDLYTNGFYLTPDIVSFMGEKAPSNKIWILVTFHQHKHTGEAYDLTTVEENLLECVKLQIPNIDFILATHQTDFTDEEASKEWYARWVNRTFEYSNIEAVHVNTCISPWAGKIEQKGEMANYVCCPYQDGCHMFIGVTGNILPCCMDLEEEITLGNVLEDDLDSIMILRKEFYHNLEKDDIPEFELCQKCLN